jgi:hypothetical protein
MALNTFAALKASIADWLNRADLTSQIPDLITMAEARFNRELRCDDMDETATLTITAGVATVPTGLRSVRSIRLTASPYGKLKFVPADQLDDADPTDTGAPGFYTRVGASFLTWPPISAAASIRYRKELVPLSDGATSNWLLASHPDLYLAAPLALAFGLIKDEERMRFWESATQGMIAQINKDDMMQREDGLQMQSANTVV